MDKGRDWEKDAVCCFFLVARCLLCSVSCCEMAPFSSWTQNLSFWHLWIKPRALQFTEIADGSINCGSKALPSSSVVQILKEQNHIGEIIYGNKEGNNMRLCGCFWMVEPDLPVSWLGGESRARGQSEHGGLGERWLACWLSISRLAGGWWEEGCYRPLRKQCEGVYYNWICQNFDTVNVQSPEEPDRQNQGCGPDLTFCCSLHDWKVYLFVVGILV